MKKKIMALLCAVMCITTLFSGCGNDASKIYGEPKTQGTFSEVFNQYEDGIWYVFSLSSADETTWKPENCNIVESIYVVKDDKISAYGPKELSEELASVESISSLSEDKILKKLSKVEPDWVSDDIYFVNYRVGTVGLDKEQVAFHNTNGKINDFFVVNTTNSVQSYECGKTTYMDFEKSVSQGGSGYSIFAKRVPQNSKVELSFDFEGYTSRDYSDGKISYEEWVNHGYMTRDASGNVKYMKDL